LGLLWLEPYLATRERHANTGGWQLAYLIYQALVERRGCVYGSDGHGLFLLCGDIIIFHFLAT
jgi:hypothetical protein